MLEVLLGLIYLGNSTAYNAILSMSVLGMYVSYIIPIVYMIVYGRKNVMKKRQYGPFRLGDEFGLVVIVAAVIWFIVAIVFCTFHSVQPVTAQNMNYSVVFMGGWLFLGAICYFGFGQRKYQGPIGIMKL